MLSQMYGKRHCLLVCFNAEKLLQTSALLLSSDVSCEEALMCLMRKMPFTWPGRIGWSQVPS